MHTVQPAAALYRKLPGLLCCCVLVELVFVRLLAKAGFFMPKDGILLSFYSAVAFTGRAAFNASSVLTYLIVGWHIYLQVKCGKKVFSGSISILIIAVLNLLRLLGPFDRQFGSVYQIVFLVTLSICVWAVISCSGRRWWGLPMLLIFLSQLCAKLNIIIQNLNPTDPDSQFLIRLYQSGEVIFFASAWAFMTVTIGYFSESNSRWSFLKRPGVITAGVISVLCGVVVFICCRYSPYPRQIIMFAAGLTMSWSGLIVCASSFAAALFGFALCMLSGDQGKCVGMGFFLVMTCGYNLELTHYYLLIALGLWLVSENFALNIKENTI